MQQAVMGTIGAVLVIGGVLTIIWSRRTPDRRARPDSYFRCAWASVAMWFGALPIIGAIADITHLSAKLQDAAYAVVLIGGLTATLWFAIVGLRTRRNEFRKLQRQCIDEGRTPPRYFWTPWSIFGWTLGLGAVLVICGSLAIASIIGVLLENATVDEVERTSQTIATITTTCIFALIPIAAAAGLWRWKGSRVEAREQLAETAEPSTYATTAGEPA
ncbi:MFS family permease [Rhodococcus sp. PvR044]|uniref:hypothetical protein n=1 Tax=Rhodococcus sp. PvR044 TaxID=3156402 RepID=UPI0033916EBC